MSWFAALIAVLTSSLAAVVGYRATRILQQYPRDASRLPHDQVERLRRRERAWRYGAHVAALFSLVPVIPAILPGFDSIFSRVVVLVGTSGAAAAGVAVAKHVMKVRLLKAFAADVGILNQLTLAASGLALASFSALSYLVLRQPNAITDVLRAILGSK